jgi:hypothetical protein
MAENPVEGWIIQNEFPKIVAATSQVQDILPQDGNFLVNKSDILNKYTLKKLEDGRPGNFRKH